MNLIDWLTCKDKLIELGFTIEEIETALIQQNIIESDLIDIENYQKEPIWLKIYELHKPNVKFTIKEWKGDFSKDVEVIGNSYKVKARYQGLKHGKIVHQLFSNRYDWFDNFKTTKLVAQKFIRLQDIPDEFKNLTVNELLNKEVPTTKSLWDIYEVQDKFNEMYLTTEFGSLYVPYEALINRDFSIIENRMNTYCTSYIQDIEKRTTMLKPLISKEALQLKNYL